MSCDTHHGIGVNSRFSVAPTEYAEASGRQNRRSQLGMGSVQMINGDWRSFGVTRVQNFFLLPTTTISVSDITHDRGYSAWLRLTPTRFLFASVWWLLKNRNPLL